MPLVLRLHSTMNKIVPFLASHQPSQNFFTNLLILLSHKLVGSHRNLLAPLRTSIEAALAIFSLPQTHVPFGLPTDFKRKATYAHFNTTDFQERIGGIFRTDYLLAGEHCLNRQCLFQLYFAQHSANTLRTLIYLSLCLHNSLRIASPTVLTVWRYINCSGLRKIYIPYFFYFLRKKTFSLTYNPIVFTLIFFFNHTYFTLVLQLTKSFPTDRHLRLHVI